MPKAKRAARQRAQSNEQQTPHGVAVDEDARPVRRQQRSDVANRHDEGSGANETVDGLDEMQEAARRGAEDIPASERSDDFERLPVFDRGESERRG
jgi:hypothetical protein